MIVQRVRHQLNGEEKYFVFESFLVWVGSLLQELSTELFKGGLGGENTFSVGLVCLLSVKIQVLVDSKQATLMWGS